MNTTMCNSRQIDAFLADALSETELQAFEQHLDECSACCAELQRRTADVSDWDNARRFLRSDQIDDSGDSSGAAAQDPLPRLDFLGPTDDPQMLGRFAGYEIAGVIGCGGMGIVLKGFDSALNRYAAIKVLAPHFASSGASRQRFAREAQAAAAVVHDNVIAIHGVSEFNGLPYLIMPYVKGISLQKRIDRGGPLELAEMLRIALQTARGLAAAHDQGLVHRDIKPANILLPENVERVLITDFGLARAADDASLTRSGVIAGTPQYMSPEQARGEAIDYRSDLFSLGCVMYAMATGHAPFRAETPYGILRRITDTPHRPLHELRSDIPPWFCVIVDRLLEKQAARRYASAKETAALLEACVAHVQQPMKVSLPAELRASRQIRRRFVTLCVMAVCLTIAIAIAVRQSAWVARLETSPSRPQVDRSNQRLPEWPVPEPTEAIATSSPPEFSPAPTEADLRWQDDESFNALESAMQELKLSLSDVDAEKIETKGIHE